MKVLVIGSGGREHAVIRKLAENKEITHLYCAPGNGGIRAQAQTVNIAATDVEKMVDFAKREGIDFVVVTPDDPLVLGMADAMEAAGIPAFGPSRAAARIEGSKVFAKNLMQKYGIPTAQYAVFSDPAAALDYIRRRNRFPAVIKADGLALGKGVVIAQDLDEARAALHAIMEEKIFGQSGSQVVVEEFLTGKEVSVLAFTDGHVVRPMVSSMDHKRAYDNDEGPNTGGMGTIAPSPYYTPEVADRCMREIFLPTIEAMNREGCPFRGCLYFGLILTADGPRVIEYNCRFGDPETQVVLPLLQSDLFSILRAVREERLSRADITWRDGAAACVVLASGGYPKKYQTGFPIAGLDADGGHAGAIVYHAGTKWQDGQYLTAGGRVLGVTGLGDTLEEAIRRAYAAAADIRFENRHYRTDIGRK